MIINTKVEATEHQAYYKQGGIEAIDVIEDWHLDFSLGNAVKYISRAGRKDPKDLVKDLSKADWYIQREIEFSNKPEFMRFSVYHEKFTASAVARAWNLNEKLTDALYRIYAAVCLPDGGNCKDLFRTELSTASKCVSDSVSDLEKACKEN